MNATRMWLTALATTLLAAAAADAAHFAKFRTFCSWLHPRCIGGSCQFDPNTMPNDAPAPDGMPPAAWGGMGMGNGADYPPPISAHPYARSPRDFFMWSDVMNDQLTRGQRPALVP
jgi:hypothetical protein